MIKFWGVLCVFAVGCGGTGVGVGEHPAVRIPNGVKADGSVNYLSKKLGTPIPVADTQIGKSMDDLRAQYAQSRTPTVEVADWDKYTTLETFKTGDVVDLEIDTHARQNGSVAEIDLYVYDGDDSKSYLSLADTAGIVTKKVNYYEESYRGGFAADDANRDGKTDWVSEAISRLPDYKPEGYGDLSRYKTFYNRILQDSDFDGLYDVEAITVAP